MSLTAWQMYSTVSCDSDRLNLLPLLLLLDSCDDILHQPLQKSNTDKHKLETNINYHISQITGRWVKKSNSTCHTATFMSDLLLLLVSKHWFNTAVGVHKVYRARRVTLVLKAGMVCLQCKNWALRGEFLTMGCHTNVCTFTFAFCCLVLLCRACVLFLDTQVLVIDQ